jgi:hypothetical protein
VIVLVMVNDNRERHLHRRWADLARGSDAALPPVATTSYRKLRACSYRKVAGMADRGDLVAAGRL